MSFPGQLGYFQDKDYDLIKYVHSTLYNMHGMVR